MLVFWASWRWRRSQMYVVYVVSRRFVVIFFYRPSVVGGRLQFDFDLRALWPHFFVRRSLESRLLTGYLLSIVLLATTRP